MNHFGMATNVDWDGARKRMEAFWECDMLDRPCFRITCWPGKDNPKVPVRPQIRTPFTCEEDRAPAESFSRGFRNGYRQVMYYAEGFPNLYPNWEGISLMYGCKVKDFGNSFGILPVVDSIHDFDASVLDINHLEVRRLLERLEHYAVNSSGEGAVGWPPFGIVGDTVAKVVGYTNLLTDLAECPEEVIKAEEAVADFWCALYDRAYETVSKYQDGTCTWLPTWYEGRGALIEFDFSAMISPELYKLYLPVILQRASHVERNIYHLDGTLAARHLDIILQQKEIHAIQWEPGVQCHDLFEWIPLMQKIQAAGKALYVSGPCPNAETAKALLKHLSPKGLMMPVSVGSVDEAEKFLEDVVKMYR